MTKFLKIAMTAALVVSFAAPSFADNANWSASKAKQIDANRNSDAGIGNGGERRRPRNGQWLPTRYGEDGGLDVDPGNSGDNNNACHEDGRPRDTSC